jgi:hypothetical protein
MATPAEIRKLLFKLGPELPQGKLARGKNFCDPFGYPGPVLGEKLNLGSRDEGFDIGFLSSHRRV